VRFTLLLFRPHALLRVTWMAALVAQAPSLRSAEPAAFETWAGAVNAFLAEPVRFSQFSGVNHWERLALGAPRDAARFERLIETLPPAKEWGALPALTRARLPVGYPRNRKELNTWWDAQLLHLWVLTIHLPATHAEMCTALDRIRTVRWMIQEEMIPEAEVRSSTRHLMEQVEQSLRTYAAEPDGSPEAAPDKAFEKALEDVSGSLRGRASSLIGEDALKGLERVAVNRRNLRDAHQACLEAEGASLRDFRILLELAEKKERDTTEGQRAIRPAEVHQDDLRKARATLKEAEETNRRHRLVHPDTEAWFDLGPIPPCVLKWIRPEDRDAEEPHFIRVPDLVADCGEERAAELLTRAVALPVELEWSHSGTTALLAAQWIAEGRLRWPVPAGICPDPSIGLMRVLVAEWPEPRAERADAVLLLADWLEKHSGEDAILELGLSRASALARWRGLAHLAAGHPEQVSRLHVEEEGSDYFGLEALECLPAECAPSIARFLQQFLDVRVPRDLRDWEYMQRHSRAAGQAREALALLEKHQAALPQNEALAQLLWKARMDAGGRVGATAIQKMLRSTPGRGNTFTTAQRTQSIRRLYELGTTNRRPEWQRQALSEAQRLIAYWSTGARRGQGDGGEPWSHLAGWLAGLGRLDLATASAELNLRWALHHEEAMRYFLNSPEEENRIHEGPAVALTGLTQALLLQKKPREVVRLLEKNPHWPAWDLVKALECADPSFLESQRLPLGEIAARALEQIGRGREAQKIRAAIRAQDWQGNLNQRLATWDGPALTPEEELGVRLLLGPVTIPQGVAEPDLLSVASALDKLAFPPALWEMPEIVFPLKAAAAGRKDDRDNPETSRPMPRTSSFRAFIMASITCLKPIREALLENAP